MDGKSKETKSGKIEIAVIRTKCTILSLLLRASAMSVYQSGKGLTLETVSMHLRISVFSNCETESNE